MNSNLPRRALLAAILFASPLVRAQTPTPAKPVPTADEVLKLSPFEVVDSGRGYYGTNTMSGTRINAKIEDLASAITVITKEQMADFAMLDINDIFAYEVSTESSYNY